MGLLKLKLGEIIPLTNNGYDGATDIFPRAVVRDDTNAVIATENLPHIGDGLFRSIAVAMPATSFVYVLHRVYTDATYTVLDENYAELTDVFLLADAVISPNSLAIIERIQFTLGQNKLDLELSKKQVVATLKQNKLLLGLHQNKIQVCTRQTQKIQLLVKEC